MPASPPRPHCEPAPPDQGTPVGADHAKVSPKPQPAPKTLANTAVSQPDSAPECRLCHAPLSTTFVDLGSAPPCEAILTSTTVEQAEPWYPLHAWTCTRCLLVQVPEVIGPEQLFTPDYAYFSSYSTSWLEHARQYAEAMRARLNLGSTSRVIEVASNDGYLLRYFAGLGVPVLGIEPTANTAAAAQQLGIPTVVEFLSQESARRIAATYGTADLLVANNVYAHVPQLADFTAGLATLLDAEGTLTIEVAHLAQLMAQRQFDTIYHEHFQYYTLLTLGRALALGGLTITDAQELATHGGSLRVFARHTKTVARAGAGGISDNVGRILAAEAAAGLHEPGGYAGFAASVQAVKRDLVRFLLQAQERGERVVGYGAPGKGNTLLNYCGIGPDLLPFTVDRNPHKHGCYLPGSRIPIYAPEMIEQARPDYILVLPWNLRTEITEQLAWTASWGAKLVFAIPHLDIVDPAEPQHQLSHDDNGDDGNGHDDDS